MSGHLFHYDADPEVFEVVGLGEKGKDAAINIVIRNFETQFDSYFTADYIRRKLSEKGISYIYVEQRNDKTFLSDDLKDVDPYQIVLESVEDKHDYEVLGDNNVSVVVYDNLTPDQTIEKI